MPRLWWTYPWHFSWQWSGDLWLLPFHPQKTGTVLLSAYSGSPSFRNCSQCWRNVFAYGTSVSSEGAIMLFKGVSILCKEPKKAVLVVLQIPLSLGWWEISHFQEQDGEVSLWWPWKYPSSTWKIWLQYASQAEQETIHTGVSGNSSCQLTFVFVIKKVVKLPKNQVNFYFNHTKCLGERKGWWSSWTSGSQTSARWFRSRCLSHYIVVVTSWSTPVKKKILSCDMHLSS